MRITPDTNVLVRAITEDDEKQAKLAQAELAGAELVALTLPALCELVWVLSESYGVAAPEVAETIRRLMSAENVVLDRPAVEAGLAHLDAGGDFADGVIAHSGAWLGAEAFVSFDKQALKLVKGRGHPARAPSAR